MPSAGLGLKSVCTLGKYNHDGGDVGRYFYHGYVAEDLVLNLADYSRRSSNSSMLEGRGSRVEMWNPCWPASTQNLQ